MQKAETRVSSNIAGFLVSVQTSWNAMRKRRGSGGGGQDRL
jgi:hypothetical protein